MFLEIVNENYGIHAIFNSKVFFENDHHLVRQISNTLTMTEEVYKHDQSYFLCISKKAYFEPLFLLVNQGFVSWNREGKRLM